MQQVLPGLKPRRSYYLLRSVAGISLYLDGGAVEQHRIRQHRQNDDDDYCRQDIVHYVVPAAASAPPALYAPVNCRLVYRAVSAPALRPVRLRSRSAGGASRRSSLRTGGAFLCWSVLGVLNACVLHILCALRGSPTLSASTPRRWFFTAHAFTPPLISALLPYPGNIRAD